ncbi:hypothetical protein BDZ45DRAFT_750027 [Acephala macrosclerotiorum]|nr:hypothetical protein BDZ45DRAFT_750027 [Acephala macrosclerotiorum]
MILADFIPGIRHTCIKAMPHTSLRDHRSLLASKPQTITHIFPSSTIHQCVHTVLFSKLALEVLILQSCAFSPVGWELPGIERLFRPHFETPEIKALFQGIAEEEEGRCEGIFGWLRDLEKEMAGEEWEIDFESTYVLHAFDEGIERIKGWNHRVDLGYVLRRQSNYARAMFPAVRHAIEAGVIEGVKEEDCVWDR